MRVELEKSGWELEKTQSDGRCVHGDSRTEERLGIGNGQTGREMRAWCGHREKQGRRGEGSRREDGDSQQWREWEIGKDRGKGMRGGWGQWTKQQQQKTKKSLGIGKGQRER